MLFNFAIGVIRRRGSKIGTNPLVPHTQLIPRSVSKTRDAAVVFGELPKTTTMKSVVGQVYIGAHFLRSLS